MKKTTPLPGNPYAEAAAELLRYVPSAAAAQEPLDVLAGFIAANTQATLALAREQHQRNRLAAMTALAKGLDLPPDLEDLALEGADRRTAEETPDA